MANDAVATWSVKFLKAISVLSKALTDYNKASPTLNKHSPSLTRHGVYAAGQTLLSLRSELSGIFAASADISSSTATSILTPLDTALAPISDGSWRVGPKSWKGTGALLDWFNTYIKPLK